MDFEEVKRWAAWLLAIMLFVTCTACGQAVPLVTDEGVNRSEGHVAPLVVSKPDDSKARPVANSTIPEEYIYFDEVTALQSEGIVSKDFDPERNLTGGDLSRMLSRASGFDDNGDADLSNLENQVWFDDLLIEYYDASLPAAMAKLCMYKYFDMDIYHEVVYDTHETMTCGQAAYFFAKCRDFAGLGVEIEYETGYAGMAQTIRELLIGDMPHDVLAVFVENGWKVHVGSEYILKYAEENDTANIVGLCSYKNNTIYVLAVTAIIHEMGHFVDKFMWDFDGRDELFDLEGEACLHLISSYGSRSKTEFMAEAFAYYVHHRHDSKAIDAMREQMPETYKYLSVREENGWVSPLAA